MQIDLKPCPFCGGVMMLRGALWPSEGDTDAVIHAEPTDCPMYDFCDGTADGSIAEKWNRRALTSATPPDVAGAELDPKLERMLSKWESPAYQHVMLPGTAMTCDLAAPMIRAATALRLSAGGEAQPVGYANLYRDEDGGYRLGGIDVYPQPEPEWGEFSDDFLGPAAIVPLHALPASPTVEAGHVE